MATKGTGALFAEDAHGAFMRLTGSRYDSMDNRMEHKKLPPLPFSKAQFRSHVLAALGGFEDGCCRCRYCGGYFTIKEVQADHAKPIERGGSIGLENIEFPCGPCNQQKGECTPDEFLALLRFLQNAIPLARLNILERLQSYSKLTAGLRSNAGVIGDLKRTGTWQQAQAIRRQAAKAKQMPKF
jgi:hypothetical protein